MVKAKFTISDPQTKDMCIVVEKLENLVKFAKTSPTLILRCF
jgi:hypothetical protein